MGRISDFIFEIILFIFSAFVLVLMLLGCVRLSQCEDRTEKMEASILAQRSENRMLQAKCENCMSLAELEEYALSKLGMQQCRPWQIVYMEHDQPAEG